MDEERYEVRLSGSGGQGIILAAVILAEAAGIYEGHHVCQAQSYGPEARGGKCKAEVVISDNPIDYPKVTQQDMLLAMNQAACDAYFFDFKPNGLLLVDSTLVEQLPTSRVVAIPFTQIAREKTGKAITANMVALGAIAHLCPLVKLKSMESALKIRVPKDTRDMNLEALKAGAKAARAINLASLPRSIIPQEEEEI